MKFNITFEKILNSPTKIKILRALFKINSPMSERELSRLVKVSHMSINRFMKQLSDVNLVTYERISEAHIWKLNKDSFAYKELAKIVKGFLKTEIPLEHLKKTILKSLRINGIIKIILFGSISKNQERSDSDIDLFVLTNNSITKQRINSILDRLTGLIFKLYGNRLSPYIITKKELKNKKNISLLSKIEKGIVIFQK